MRPGKEFAVQLVQMELMRSKLIGIIVCVRLGINSFAQTNEVFVDAISSDTVISVASRQYTKTPFIGQLLMGKNYRKTWSTPVRFPVFYFSKMGFKIERLGGSAQTNSLYLRDASNQLWVLRTVDKNVKRGIPGFLRFTPFYNYKKNLVAGAHPYAALVVADLLKAIDIAAPSPTYYFVADDEGLGVHKNLFANTVCMLEKRDPTTDGSSTEETDSVVSKMNRGTAYPVLQKQVLKARIIDMLVGDWDRHEGQWRWAVMDGNGKKYY